MSRSVLVLLLAAAVLAVVAFLVLGGGGADDPRGLERGGLEDDPTAGDELDPLGTDAGRGAEGSVPVALFGRPREKRPGRGAVTGIVANAKTGGPVADAELLLSGKSHDRRDVLVRARSDAEGRFAHGHLAAGEGYVLKVAAEGLPGRTIGGIQVSDGEITKLGKIWIGEPASITGRVLAMDGRGVGRADVRLYPALGSVMDLMGDMMGMLDRLDEESVPVLETIAGTDGRFELAGVAPGTWTVIATAGGYGQAIREVTVTATAPPDVLFRLAEAEVLSGVVVDGADRPIANVRVAVTANQNPLAFLYGRRFAVTGPDGRFEIDLEPGHQGTMLMAAAKGYPTHMTPIADDVRETKIVLDRGCRLTVELLALPNDEPVEGAQLMVAVSDAATLGQRGAGAMAHGRTGADGTTDVDVSTGKIQIVWVSHPESGSSMWMPQMSRLPFGMKGPDDPEVPAGARTITLRIPARQLIVGTVRGPKGEPVVGASVSSPFSAQIGGSPAITDAEGQYRYHAPEFPGGAVVLSVTASGYIQDSSTLSAAGKKPDANGEIQHDLKMDRAAVIQGRVLGPTRKPLAGVRVKVNLGMQAAMMGGMLGGSSETLTGEDGTYLLENIRPGSGTSVVARRDGYLDSVSGEFEVEEGGVTKAPDLLLTTGARVVVWLQDPDGRALSSARAEYSFDRKDEATWDLFEMFTQDRTVAADAGGRVVVENVPPGTATFTLSHKDHASAKASVQVTEDDEEKVVTIRARAARRLEGKVVDSDGRPLAGALIRVTDPSSGTHVGSTYTSSIGHYEIARVPEGEVGIHVSAAGFTRRTVGPEEAAEIRLQPVSADTQARLEEVRALLMQKNTAMLEADNAAERQALQQEIAQLSEELNRLEAEAE